MDKYDKELVRLIAQQEIIKREISQMKKHHFGTSYQRYGVA